MGLNCYTNVDRAKEVTRNSDHLVWLVNDLRFNTQLGSLVNKFEPSHELPV
jgi:hypothetical protein